MHPHRQRPHGESIRLERWHRLVVYGIASALAATGMLWLLFHYFVHAQGAFGQKPHPLTMWWLRLHGAAAMLALIGAGSMVLTHMRRAWRVRRNRGWGGTLGMATVILIVTGYLLYYASDEDVRNVVSKAHWVVGLVCVALLPLHARLGRPQSRKSLPERLEGPGAQAIAGFDTTLPRGFVTGIAKRP